MENKVALVVLIIRVVSYWFYVTKDLFYFYLFIYFLAVSRAAPVAYGGSQARDLIGAVATGLRQSQHNAGSKPRLQPTPQLTATPDP